VARALLADFPVLVLDEPAEHLDPAAADELTADLLDLTWGCATLLITHRLRGLEAVDEIVLLDAGRVVERGTHGALLARGGRYARLWLHEIEHEGIGGSYALKVMTVIAVIFFPIVLVYQAWNYHIFRGRLSAPRVGGPGSGAGTAPVAPGTAPAAVAPAPGSSPGATEAPSAG